MLALPEIQKGVRDALILDEIAGVESILVGGLDPRKRLAIHQRHYQTSLVTALLDRFPATVWLVGSEFMTAAAREFVRLRPPSRPCIAEYGEEFPTFLSTRPGAQAFPYLQQFTELEWHLGRLSIAVDVPSLARTDLPGIDTSRLGESVLALQPGVHYLHADWAIDELMSLYLSDCAPDRFVLQPGDVWLELHGLRGELRFRRLSPADFRFRVALASGEPLGDAAMVALEIDPEFDVGRRFLTLLDEGMVTAIERLRPKAAGAP